MSRLAWFWAVGALHKVKFVCISAGRFAIFLLEVFLDPAVWRVTEFVYKTRKSDSWCSCSSNPQRFPRQRLLAVGGKLLYADVWRRSIEQLWKGPAERSCWKNSVFVDEKCIVSALSCANQSTDRLCKIFKSSSSRLGEDLSKGTQLVRTTHKFRSRARGNSACVVILLRGVFLWLLFRFFTMLLFLNLSQMLFLSSSTFRDIRSGKSTKVHEYICIRARRFASDIISLTKSSIIFMMNIGIAQGSGWEYISSSSVGQLNTFFLFSFSGNCCLFPCSLHVNTPGCIREVLKYVSIVYGSTFSYFSLLAILSPILLRDIFYFGVQVSVYAVLNLLRHELLTSGFVSRQLLAVFRSLTHAKAPFHCSSTSADQYCFVLSIFKVSDKLQASVLHVSQ